MRKVDPDAVIERALSKAAKASPIAAARFERLWRQVAEAECARDITPLDQMFAVLALLDQAGCGTPSLDVIAVRRQREHILTGRQPVC